MLSSFIFRNIIHFTLQKTKKKLIFTWKRRELNRKWAALLFFFIKHLVSEKLDIVACLVISDRRNFLFIVGIWSWRGYINPSLLGEIVHNIEHGMKSFTRISTSDTNLVTVEDFLHCSWDFVCLCLNMTSDFL